MPLGPTLRSTRWRGESRAGEVHGRRDREGDSDRAVGRALEGKHDPRERVVQRQEGIGRTGFSVSRGTDAPGEQSSGAGFLPSASRREGKGQRQESRRPREGYGSRERPAAPRPDAQAPDRRIRGSRAEEGPEDGTPGALAGQNRLAGDMRGASRREREKR